MTVATKIAGAQQFWDTDAEFRSECLLIHNALKAAGGLVQTADTGQTDFTANTRTNGPGVGGYTIYRFDDVHQSSYPLFIRVDWYQVLIGRPGFAITIGTGSNGSGTITGVIRTANVMGGGGSGSSLGTCDNFISIGDGYLYVALAIISGTVGNSMSCMYSIERSTDEYGVVHPEEGITVFNTPANTKQYSIHPFGFAALGPVSTGSPLNAGANYLLWDDQLASDVGMMPSPYIMRSKLRFHRMATMRPGRVSYGSGFDATHLGATRKMLSVEQNYFGNNANNGWSNVADSSALVIPWN
jgi:hypothetical protein